MDHSLYIKNGIFVWQQLLFSFSKQLDKMANVTDCDYSKTNFCCIWPLRWIFFQKNVDFSLFWIFAHCSRLVNYCWIKLELWLARIYSLKDNRCRNYSLQMSLHAQCTVHYGCICRVFFLWFFGCFEILCYLCRYALFFKLLKFLISIYINICQHNFRWIYLQF